MQSRISVEVNTFVEPDTKLLCGIKSRWPFNASYENIDDNVVFSYGLYLSMVAGDILGVDKDIIVDIEKNLIIFKGPECIEIWSEKVWDEYDVYTKR